MMPLTDIGVNLMNSAFDRDRYEVIARAGAAGVGTLIVTGSSVESSIEAAAFAAGYAGTNVRIFSTAGVHPHNAKNWDASAQTALKELVLQPPLPIPHSPLPILITAIGECGLDYNRNFSPPDAQRKCFEEQLALAAQLGKPVFLHERDAEAPKGAEASKSAFEDFFSILKQYRPHLPGAVVHCFTGGMKELEAYLAIDCYIGITGWICDERRGTSLIPLLPNIPADRLLLETDAPYLLPRSLPKAIKGKSGRNEPCFLPHIAAFAAEILDKSQEQVAMETSSNAQRVFGF
ncbi:MAG: TatD family hydrolase [Treponema sp.]|jgi:TatD DNase family protein|nr:TatD family hydrolase [Treponema sp.]